MATNNPHGNRHVKWQDLVTHESFALRMAFAKTPGHYLSLHAAGGWVVSELFDVVHSLRPPPLCCISCILKE